MQKYKSLGFSLFALCLLSDTAFSETNRYGNFVPKEGFVPDKETAVLIAYAVLVKIYGEKEISKELPLVATLNNDLVGRARNLE